MNVFDFDNTIYDGESSLDFFLFSMRRQPSLVRYLPLILYSTLRYKMKLLSIERLYAATAKLSGAIAANSENMDAYVDEFWKLNNRRLKKSITDMISSEDVIITASAGFLVRGALKWLNTDNLISSEFDPIQGRFTVLCYRDNKPDLFRERYPDVQVENFYTDSLNDAPFMKIARNCWIVKGERVTILS